MVSSPRASRNGSQTLPTKTFLLVGFAAGILISGIIIWNSDAPAQEQADDGSRLAATLQGNSAAKLWSWALSKAHRPLVPGSEFSRDGDFVAAYYTEPSRHRLVEAGREWRKEFGIRTVVVSNVTAEEAGVTVGDQYEWDEVWRSWPDIDLKNGTVDINNIAYFAGDHRGAMTPLIAHRELGDSYKWMLYGDDDTLFFPEGVARAVKGLDPDLPYFLSVSDASSDRAWGFGFGDDRRYGETPRCVPCNFNNPQGLDVSDAPVPPLEGCPCDRVALCDHWNMHLPGDFPANCTAEELLMPVPHHFTFHGGGGTILSIGLLRQLNWTEWQECIDSMHWRQGSDSYVTKCIWRAGFGMTDPGYSYLRKNPLDHFTFDRWTYRGETPLELVPALERKITDFNEETGFCRPGGNATDCIVPDADDELFVTMVSMHGMAGRFYVLDRAIEAFGLTTKVYRDYINTISKAHPDVMNLEITIGAGKQDAQ